MERDRSLDGLKYVLIVLVILGHCLEPNRYSNLISRDLYSVIYSFHMPLFVFLSGYFYKFRCFSDEIKKCVPLFETCIISHFGFVFFKTGALSISKVLDFGFSPSWYLLSLIYWRVISSLLLRRVNVRALLRISIVLEVLTFVVVHYNGGILSIMRTSQFFPFFILGHFMQGNLNKIVAYKKQVIFLGVLSVIYILLFSSRLQHQCFFQRSGLLELAQFTDHSLLWLFCYRYSVIISSALISAMVLFFVYNNTLIQRFSLFGQGTLFIYYTQTLLYPFLPHFCISLPFSLISSAILVCLLTSFSRSPISKVLMNPFSTLLSALV